MQIANAEMIRMLFLVSLTNASVSIYRGCATGFPIAAMPKTNGIAFVLMMSFNVTIAVVMIKNINKQ